MLFSSLSKIIVQSVRFFVLTEIDLLQIRPFGVFVAFLASWILFNTYSLHFSEFVNLDPKYLNDLLPLISVLLF
jgi:hypothetical protein